MTTDAPELPPSRSLWGRRRSPGRFLGSSEKSRGCTGRLMRAHRATSCPRGRGAGLRSDMTSRSESLDVDRSDPTPVQVREREFYNSYSQLRRFDAVDFGPILGRERRPWNSYWETFRLVQQRFRPGMRLLDFGCGWGGNTVVYARIGYQVDGFDIAEGNVEAAREIAERYDLSERVTIARQAAERLNYPDKSFDVVAGIDILHHVDVPAAIAECRRVLKPGGLAVFREPLRNRFFDGVRNTRLVRRVLSNEPSLDRHITDDEHKLGPDELAAIRRAFPTTTVHRFQVLSRAAALWKSSEMAWEKFDYALRRVPGYLQLAGGAVIEVHKEG